ARPSRPPGAQAALGVEQEVPGGHHGLSLGDAAGDDDLPIGARGDGDGAGLEGAGGAGHGQIVALAGVDGRVRGGGRAGAGGGGGGGSESAGVRPTPGGRRGPPGSGGFLSSGRTRGVGVCGSRTGWMKVPLPAYVSPGSAASAKRPACPIATRGTSIS